MKDKTIRHAVFVPIYNINVSSEVVNTSVFDGYTFVRSNRIQEKYSNYIHTHDHFARQFLQDISDWHPEKSIFFPCANIVLVKEVENIDTDEENRKTAVAIKKEVNNIMLALRLSNKGLCQINNGYILSQEHSSCQQFGASSKLENIVATHQTVTGSWVRETSYELNKEILESATSVFEMLKNMKTRVFVPQTYFNKYYDSLTPHERIIQMAIVFESSMLAGSSDELNYRMLLRTSAILGRDVENILKLFYSIRSHIIHNGNIGKNKDYKSILKRLKEITKVESEEETELLFYFVRDHIEPILREVLYKSFKILAENELSDFEALNKELDKFILKQVIKDTFKPGIRNDE